MFKKPKEWLCVSEIMKVVKARGDKIVTLNVDTRDVCGLEVKPKLDNPFLGEDIDLVLMTDLFNRIRTYRWWWYKNMVCKYIRISVDLNSFTCRLQNRNGENISYKQFIYQYKG